MKFANNFNVYTAYIQQSIIKAFNDKMKYNIFKNVMTLYKKKLRKGYICWNNCITLTELNVMFAY
jgi:hypothetical protein